VYIAALICVAVGFLLGITSVKDVENPTNILIEISEGEFGYFTFYLKLILFIVITYVACWALTFNKIAFCIGNIGIIVFLSRYFVRTAIIACIAGWTGILLLLLFYIPMFIVGFFIYVEYVCSLMQLAFPCSDWTTVNSLGFTFRAVGKTIKRYLIAALLFGLIYASVFLLIFSLIF